MPTFDCIERPLALWFARYGRYVTHHPLPFIALPVLLTLLMSSGFIYLESLTDAIYLFTPLNAQSKHERQTIHDLWPLVNGSYIPGRAVTQSREVQLTVLSRDGGNILEKPYSEAVYRLDAYIQNRIKVEFEGRNYTYHDLCLSWRNQGCPGNKHVQLISDLYQHGIPVTYPTVRFGATSGYIGSSLGGVLVGKDKNGSMVLASAKSWLMVYHLQFHPTNVSFLSGMWERAFQKALQAHPEDPYITFTFFHSQTLAEELKRNSDSLVPRFMFSFSMLAVFALLCSMCTIDGTLYVDWVLSKPILAVLGVANAGMGIASAIGLLNLVGMPYNDIVGVMPFLVVAVGVDNMFLMIAAVRRTNRAYPVDKRIGECMSDAAISMFITMTTDALSFGVGTITSIPAVQIFCVYTCVAILITFLYQVTFFCGLLSLSLKWESEGLHCIFMRPTVPERMMGHCKLWTKIFWLSSQADPDPANVAQNLKESAAAKFFRNWYSPVLMQPIVRILVAGWYCLYLAFAVYGCLQLREGLEPINLLVEDSYAIPHYRVLQDYFWQYGTSVQIVVNNPPDLRLPEERRRVERMVHDFANNRHAIGDDSVQFWMFVMDSYYQVELGVNVTDAHFYGLARHFFAAKSTEYWPEDVKWGERENGTAWITAFRFLVGMRDIESSTEQQDATAMFREIAANYSDYNVTTFYPLWLFTDQYALVVPNTIQNIVIAIGVMVVIAVLLIPQPMCALWVALAIGSIDVGVIGYMTLWGVNLDVISMITIIMSIGFSVDYAAHITYGYVVSEEKLPSERIQQALGALGWPLTQGAISTILAVVVLADVPAYMIVTFFKTVFLAISLGLLHGLVFLPITLSLFVRGFCMVTGPAKKDLSDHSVQLPSTNWNDGPGKTPSPISSNRVCDRLAPIPPRFDSISDTHSGHESQSMSVSIFTVEGEPRRR